MNKLIPIHYSPNCDKTIDLPDDRTFLFISPKIIRSTFDQSSLYRDHYTNLWFKGGKGEDSWMGIPRATVSSFDCPDWIALRRIVEGLKGPYSRRSKLAWKETVVVCKCCLARQTVDGGGGVSSLSVLMLPTIEIPKPSCTKAAQNRYLFFDILRCSTLQSYRRLYWYNRCKSGEYSPWKIGTGTAQGTANEASSSE